MAEVRTAGQEDSGVLAGIFVECFSSPPWNEPWTHQAAQRRLGMMLSAPSARALVAMEEYTIVGMALGQVEGWLDGDLFVIQELCVHPSWRNKGIGRSLLTSLCARVRDEDYVRAVYLLTDADSSAESFYAGCGFGRSKTKVVLGVGAEQLNEHLG